MALNDWADQQPLLSYAAVRQNEIIDTPYVYCRFSLQVSAERRLRYGTPSGRFFFHVMVSLAEMERELIVERTRAGLDVARQLGRKGGRKRQMTDSKIVSAKKLLVSGVPLKDVAKNLGVSLPTLYRWVPASAHA